MPARHALIVGIDRYSNFEEQYQLSGCVNDARLIKSVLVDHFGFDDSAITELHDAAASQQGILDAMAKLAERIGQDDVVVFHFSGHGRQRTAASDDEGIGLDSTITPSDSGAVDPYPNLDITDDVIREWLERLAEKTRNTTLIFDCCHSGTITRDANGARIRGLPADRRALSSMDVRGLRGGEDRPGTRSAGAEVRRRLEDSYVVISGCRDDEYSHEYSFEQGGQSLRSGALTHFLTGALLRARPGSTYRDVFEIARQGVNTSFPQQHPQIEGAQDREIFGTRDIEPIRFIPVVAVEDGRVTLGGGAAHGLSIGSVWTAYPQGTKQVQGSEALGRIEITAVDSLSSEGTILDDGDIGVGARCVESAPAADRFRMSVSLGEVDEDRRAGLEARIAGSSLLARVEAPDAADMRVGIVASEAGQGPASDDARSWAVLDRAGELAFPLAGCDEDGAVEKLVSNLESIARYRNALALDNPRSALDVDFNIYRVDPDGQLENANGGLFTFDEGDGLAFEIVNREDRNVFVSVLDFGLTGRISLVYPQNRAGEMVAAGNTFRYGVGRHKLVLGVPADFDGAQGTETLKAFISTDEADFRWLQQGGVRSASSGGRALRRQFEAAYNGPGTREITTVDSSGGDDEDWKAPARSFELRRATK